MVEQDLVQGVEYLHGLPPLRLIRTERRGGVLDLLTQRFTGDFGDRPVVWYVGERQFEILTRRDPERTRTLLYSAEGGGKTVIAAQWAVIQVLGLMLSGEPGHIGATAPTGPRLDTLVKAVGERIPIDSAAERRPGAWATYFVADRELRFPTGHAIQFRATKKASEAVGSPIQGQTWKASVDDELQDTAANGADPDIEARLRGARVSYRMCTATAKDSPGWRTFRDEKEASPDWNIERLSYTETPFVWPDHWERLKRNLSDREWKRRALALDVGPERALYHAWEREHNVRPVPRIGAKDVTQRVTGYSALVGHDPGRIWDVSMLMRCYEVRGERLWWIIDEFSTRQTTLEEHIAQFKDHLQQEHHLQYPDPDEPKVIVRPDPWSESSDPETDRSVYIAWKRAGFKAVPAAFNKQGEGRGTIPKEARFSMMNRLFRNAAGVRRLFVDCDERRKPVAPRFVEAVETAARDETGRGEAERKDIKDKSHWPAATAHGLWPYEKLRDVHGIRQAGVVL